LPTVERVEVALLVVHLAATGCMCGLIWCVQVVHYALFDGVGAAGFVEYERRHQRAISWIVGPFMAVEGVSALAIAVWLRDEVGLVLVGAGLALLAVIHASTVFLQVPAHGRLGAGYDAQVVVTLVRTNWIRTLGWTARTVVAGAMVVVATG
jgi:hypothetical protein